MTDAPPLSIRLLISWLTNALVLGVVAAVLSDVHVDSAGSLLLAAAVFGVLNTLFKPLLRLVTLPLAVITFGLAWFFVSMLMLVLTRARDVGDNTWEEFDEVGPGFNGGWPLREGPAPYAAPPSCDQVLPGYDDPIDVYDHDEGVVIIAAGLLRRISGSYWPPHWEGAAFYADFYAGFVRMLQKSGGAWQRVSFNGQPDPDYFATGLNSPVDFCWGPEGDLWWLSYEDKTFQTGTGSLHRIHATVPLGVGAPATTAMTLTTSPNPTTNAVTVRFTMPRSGPARLTVFDTQGRVVLRLVDASLPAGAHVTRWDGRETVGTRAAAGVYLIRLETEAGVIATRIVFMR